MNIFVHSHDRDEDVACAWSERRVIFDVGRKEHVGCLGLKGNCNGCEGKF